MRGAWRRWWPGAKHGIARGVAVYGSPGFDDPAVLRETLSRCERLRTWASSQGVRLRDDPDGLAALDWSLEAWAAEPDVGPSLGNEAGCYLGT